MARTRKKGSSKGGKKGRKGKKSKNKISVDFEGVEAGGRPVVDGPYHAKVSAATLEESDEGNDYVHVRLKMIEGLDKRTKRGVGGLVHDNLSLQPQALWKLRGFLESAGQEVEDGPMEFDVDDLVDLEVGVEVANEEWEGKDRPRVTGYFPLEESEEEEEEEEEEPEEEEEEESEEEEEEDEDEEEEEEEEEEKPRRRGKGKGKNKKEDKKKSKKIRVGSKVKFKDEEDDWVKGVITELDDDTAQVEDTSGETWEVDVSELKPV